MWSDHLAFGRPGNPIKSPYHFPVVWRRDTTGHEWLIVTNRLSWSPRAQWLPFCSLAIISVLSTVLQILKWYVKYSEFFTDHPGSAIAVGQIGLFMTCLFIHYSEHVSVANSHFVFLFYQLSPDSASLFFPNW